MPFLLLLEILIAVVVIFGVVTQIIVPIFSGKPWFPIFRMKEEDKELSGVAGEIEKEKIRIEIKKLADELYALHKVLESQTEPQVQPITPKEEKKDAS